MDLKDPTYAALDRYTKALAVALGYRDIHTKTHSDRVVAISEAVGVRMGLTETDLGNLTISAAFHDIGKIGTPDHILLKAAKLNPSETAEMQRHSELGESIVLATDLDGAMEVAQAIRHHHEHFDGHGYPDGLVGEAIPPSSRIIGIADSYDAMAVTRAYHPARTHAEIMKILDEETGRKHDPRIMSVFCEVIEASPLKAAAG